MICESCNEELATIHLTEIDGGKRTEAHLCEPCGEPRLKALNAGRDLRAEAKAVTLGAVKEAAALGDQAGIKVIMNALEPWVGGTDRIFAMLGRPAPIRPQEVFDGVSEALAEIDPADMEITHSLGLITTTNTVKERIPEWLRFVKRSYAHYLDAEGEEKADALIKGFL